MIVKLVRVSEGNVFDGVIAVTWLDCVVTADVHGGCAWRMCMADVHGECAWAKVTLLSGFLWFCCYLPTYLPDAYAN